MVKGLFRDTYGWVEIDYGTTRAPIPREKYIAGRYRPPYATLPVIAPPSSPERGNDANYWRSRAEEVRTIADQMIDRDAILTMLKVAEQYEGLAQKAEHRRLDKNSD